MLCILNQYWDIVINAIGDLLLVPLPLILSHSEEIIISAHSQEIGSSSDYCKRLNWAKCDTLCNHAVGSFVEKYPDYIENLKDWTRSENRWFRRAAAVTLIVPAKHGKFLDDILEIADKLLQDKDDLVQKGYGWMLKEASRIHQKEVFDFVLRNNKNMPRTALRYAIEKMPEELRRQAMGQKIETGGFKVYPAGFIKA